MLRTATRLSMTLTATIAAMLAARPVTGNRIVQLAAVAGEPADASARLIGLRGGIAGRPRGPRD